MRFIGIIDSQRETEKFSAYLNSQKIAHQIEILISRDWGSNNYGTPVSRIWIIDEDLVDQANKELATFLENPHDPRFDTNAPPSSLKVISEKPEPQGSLKTASSMGRFTFYIVVICSWIFLWGGSTDPELTSLPPSFPATPLLSPPIYKTLYYDYPKAFVFVDKLVQLYGVEKLQNPQSLPLEGQYLYKQFKESSVWQGIYPTLVHWINPTSPVNDHAPLFEKIREGEIWRLFSPAFLHSDIFHILFNMVWLIVIGRQMENRVGAPRYILFILLTGIFSNTLQYFMSGANFVGFSGVLCAMLAFVWVRKKIAPWEGYQLERSTLVLITVFILAMLALQFVDFFVYALSDRSFTPGIANTAHLAGALIGALFGYLNFFRWRPPSKEDIA